MNDAPHSALAEVTGAAERVTGAFTAADAAELAVVVRGGFVESRHLGSAVVLGRDAEVIRALGAPQAPVLARSSLKPLQALAALSAGAELAGAELAVAVASHTGTPEHVQLVRGILGRAGLPESALGCIPALPADAAARAAVRQAGGQAAPVYMECSGKHAAMLLATVANGWDVAGYLEAEHPLQKHVVETVERLTGEKVAASAVDGCGAPVHAVSLVGLARAVQRIATAQASSPFPLYKRAAAITQAVRENPWAVHGPGGSDTVIAERLGVFSKRGAEGVLVMAAPDGTTVALKMLDGSSRAAAAVGLTLLVKTGALTAAAVAPVLREVTERVLGGGQVVGQLRPTV